MKQSEINKTNIDLLMELFYNKIRSDKTGLGVIFISKIGNSDHNWTEHKAKISSFWQGMLLGSGDYRGQPMRAHLDLPPFDRALFGTWLGLFEQSLDAIFTPEIKAVILNRARAIAQRFEFMIFEAH
ncbi:MAG: group III truncated hemoglobin [Helicobacter sp.]|nr:group III truncated hemoglobin [Helicobacter sp.]